MLDERKRKILRAIIDDYILTAEPVGSRTIARKYELGISPATIRNEMADLELLGYLEQPHTSAGRIPSAKGYRFYVDCLLAPPKMSEREIAIIQNWYTAKVRRIEEVFQETTKILSRMTRNFSLVLASQFTQSTFRYLQFLPLDDHRVIVVIVTDTGFVENKVIEIPPGTSLEELQRIAVGINNRLSGLTFDRIKGSLLTEIKKDIISTPEMLEAALDVIQRILSGERNSKLYLGGTAQLFNQPEFRDVEKMRNLLSMLEEEKILCDILDIGDNDGVIVTIGEENKFTGIQNCSMVQATYRVDGQVVGAVAILGPTRMEYGKIMAVLEFMHEHLGEILKKYRI